MAIGTQRSMRLEYSLCPFVEGKACIAIFVAYTTGPRVSSTLGTSSFVRAELQMYDFRHMTSIAITGAKILAQL
jgi:hypothetical protein